MILPKISLKRKLVLGILLFLLVLPFFTRPALAYETKGFYYFQFEEAIKSDEMNLQSFVYETLRAIIGSAHYAIVGALRLPGEKQEAGLIPIVGMMIAGVYSSPPASGVQYLADLGRNLGIVKPVYAQGKGFRIMEPTQPIWKAFRNLTYVLFTLILVAMGFAIMFRVKISPQAVITIQSALPRIVLALVLITFSYAIVGFMLDIMMFVNLLIAKTFEGIMNEAPGGGTFLAFVRASDFIRGLTLPATLENLWPPLNTASAYITVSSIVFLLFTTIFVPFLGIIFSLIIAILLLIALLRCLWALLKAFTMIILNLIFAPFRILIGVLPGSDAISSWFRDLLANIAVFPAMLIMFFLGSYFMWVGVVGIVEEKIEDLTNLFSLTALQQAFSEIEVGLLQSLILMIFPIVGIMILLLAPRVADIIQSFIMRKPFEYGTAIGQAFGPVGAIGKPLIYTGAEEIYQRGVAAGMWGAAHPVRERIARLMTEFIQRRISK